jgi:hypothetical protein
MTTPTATLPNGLEHIALSFSGGGYRAASFALGCVAYLHHSPYDGIPLLNRVKFISSASGGSITNLVLCSMLREGHDFMEVYHHLTEQLKGCKLIDEVFRILEDDQSWKARPEKTRNIINAFAMVYDRDLFQGRTFGSLFTTPPGGQFYVDETCVNATEFNNGLNFRFGTKGELGNEFLHFRTNAGAMQTVRNIKLADILACSSCFPAGFEPIMFPRDFTWGSLSAGDLRTAMFADNQYNEGLATSDVGFMDGGIDDNQGIYAFTLADDRKKHQFYDLYMPCDVSSNYLHHPFSYPKTMPHPLLKRSIQDWAKWGSRLRLWYILGSVLVLLIGYFLVHIAETPHVSATGILLPGGPALGLGYGLLGFGLAALLLPLVVWLWVRKIFRSIRQQIFSSSGRASLYQRVFKKHMHVIQRMPLGELMAMGEARSRSVILLATTIFLKKIRRVSYKQLFDKKSIDVYNQVIGDFNQHPKADPVDPGRLWKDHIAMSAVYQLSSKNASQLKKDLSKEPWDETTPVDATAAKGADPAAASGPELLVNLLQPSETLSKVVNTATNMGTTLWFDTKDDECQCWDCLLATGQATMCFNMLRFSYRFANSEDAWITLRARLVEDWKRFNVDPFWMTRELNASAGAADGQTGSGAIPTEAGS